MSDPKPLSDEALAELEWLVREAKPGPYALRIAKAGIGSCLEDALGRACLAAHYVMTEQSIGALGEDIAAVPDDGAGLQSFLTARLLVSARNALPSLLAEVRASRAGGPAPDANAPPPVCTGSGYPSPTVYPSTMGMGTCGVCGQQVIVAGPGSALASLDHAGKEGT